MTQKITLLKPCTLESLLRRKSWDIFAFPNENIDIFIFGYTSLRFFLNDFKIIHNIISKETVVKGGV
jgi:hypothetical protein